MSKQDYFFIGRDGITLERLERSHEVVTESIQAQPIGDNRYVLTVVVKVRKRCKKK